MSNEIPIGTLCRFGCGPVQPSENRCCAECREALGRHAPQRLPIAPVPMKGEVARLPA